MNTTWIRALFSRTNVLHRSAAAALVIGTAAVLSGCGGGGTVAPAPRAVNAPSSTKLDSKALRHTFDLRSSSVPSTQTAYWTAQCFQCDPSDYIYWSYSGANGNVYTQSFTPNPTVPFQTATQTIFIAGNTPPGTYYVNVSWTDSYGCVSDNACGNGTAIVTVSGPPPPPPTPTPPPGGGGGGGGGRCIEAVRTGGTVSGPTSNCYPPQRQPQ